jgi:hypothetical protein
VGTIWLFVGDLVKLKVCVMEAGREEGSVSNAVKIRDGVESHHVGFLPRHIAYGQRLESVQNKKYGQMLEIACIKLGRLYKEEKEWMYLWHCIFLSLG